MIEVVLVWVVRVLVVLLVLRLAGRLLTAGRATPRGRRPGRGAEPRSGGTLVQDPQCGTYLPASRAIAVPSGSNTLYFCSNTCRDAFFTARASSA